MRFPGKILKTGLLVASLFATFLTPISVSAVAQPGGGGGLWTGAIRNYVMVQLPNGNWVSSSIVTVQGGSLIGCNANAQQYINGGATWVRPCQQGVINLDGVK